MPIEPENQKIEAPGKEYKGERYGKRPLWQWILIYLVVGGILYLLIYYLFIAGGY